MRARGKSDSKTDGQTDRQTDGQTDTQTDRPKPLFSTFWGLYIPNPVLSRSRFFARCQYFHWHGSKISGNTVLICASRKKRRAPWETEICNTHCMNVLQLPMPRSAGVRSFGNKLTAVFHTVAHSKNNVAIDTSLKISPFRMCFIHPTFLHPNSAIVTFYSDLHDYWNFPHKNAHFSISFIVYWVF